MATPFTLDMVDGGGILTLRDAEPYVLEAPTRITGTVDTGDGGTGVVTGASFSSPTVVMSFDVTTPVVATVQVRADFFEVTPASGVGSMDADGNVLIQQDLGVDLNIRVIGLEDDCRAAPIRLSLESTSPYDPQTGLVTLADEDFTIPPVTIGGSCTATIGEPVNDMLSGSGHSLSLAMAGAIDLPPPAGCPTVSTLAVDPTAGSRIGDDVTLTATVQQAPGTDEVPECADVPATPAGFVELRDGGTVLATVPLSSGTASFTTGGLPAGDRELTARYRGEPPFSASTSEVATYRVAATPAIVTTLPEHIQIGVPTPFEVEIDNTDLGFAVLDGRLDVSLARAVGSAAFGPDNVVLEHRVGDDWLPVALTVPSPRKLVGSVGSAGPLHPGDDLTIPMRITLQTAGSLIPGRLDTTFELVEVDPITGLPAPVSAPAPSAVAATRVSSVMVEAARRPTTLNFQISNPVVGGPPLQAPVVRQGATFHMRNMNLSTPGTGGTQASGTVEVLLDGRSIGVRRVSPLPTTPLGEGYLPHLPLTAVGNGGVGSLEAVLPPDVATGVHEVVVRYSGDALFLPTTSPTTTITVLPAVGPVFDCQAPGPFGAGQRFTVQVQAHANLPAYARTGDELSLGQLDVRVVADRGQPGSALSIFGTTALPVGEGRLEGIRFTFSHGAGTATSLTRTGTTLMTTPDPANPDQVVTFDGEAGTVAVDGAPGEVVSVTLDSLNIDFTESGLAPAGTFYCVPKGDPVLLDEVAIAGTSLAVSPADGARAGDELTLTATVAPAGVPGNVVFSDGDATVGVVPVAPDGTASTTVTAVEGVRTYRARFMGGLGVLSTSAEQVVTVAAIACPDATEEGNGAVVRLVYLELLGRCPEPAGYDHWVGRLDGGTSAVAFARAIARTPEAVGKVVDDAYRTMLERSPDPAGRAFWVGRLQVSGRYDRLLADLGASGEFWTKAGATDEGFVTRVYEQLLGRAPDAGGLAYWTGRLEGGTSPRRLVLSLANLDEPLGRLVTASYDEILDRAPSGGERSSGIEHLRSTGDRSDLYAELIGRPEFATRAQGFPNA